jgi:LPXTG-motif cell wall-anchored protein
VIEPTPLPIDYTCPDGTVPGWLNADGLPPSCISDLPLVEPLPEPTPVRTIDPNQPELIPPIDICPIDCGTEQPVTPAQPDQLAATGFDAAPLTVLLVAALIATLAGLLLRKRASR